MKRAIWIFILLIIAAGVVFFFGWITVEPDTFVLAHSSITGTFDAPLEAGQFHWLWQKLVPKTFYQYPIQKKPAFIDIEATLPLPGSENLEEFGSFELAMRIEVEYRIDFEAAKYLFERGILATFHPLFQKELKTLVEGMLTGYTLSVLPSSPSEAQSLDFNAFDSIREDLRRKTVQFAREYRLADVGVKVIITKVPQLSIYAEALSKYSRYIEFLYTQKEEEFKAQLDLETRKKLDELEIARLIKYGDLLSQYPVLLKFLYIEKFGAKAEVVVIPENAETGFPKMLESDLGTKPSAKKPFSEEKEQPSSAAAPGETVGERKEGAAAQAGEGLVKERKWYESLMFWRPRK
jgi:hypothetical protein